MYVGGDCVSEQGKMVDQPQYHEINPHCITKLNHMDTKIKVLFKKVEHLDTFFESTLAILTRLETITAQQEKWIEKKDRRDEKRDEVLQDISLTLKSIKQDQFNTEDNIKAIKLELKQQYDDNTVKISVVIKNILFVALGVLITSIVTFIIRGGLM